MDISLFRRSEQIRKRDPHIYTLCQTGRKDTNTSSKWCKRNNKIQSPKRIWCKSNNKIQRPKQATSLFNALPEELVVNILSRLPPKTFFLCRIVCKSWLSLSSNALHLNKQLSPIVSGLFYNKCTGYTEFTGSFVNLSYGTNEVEVDENFIASPCLDGYEIVDCCNGLLLLDDGTSLASKLYVSNPTTKTLFDLGSDAQFLNEQISSPYFSLAFNTREPSIFHLICFASRIKPAEGLRYSFFVIFSFERGKCKCRQQKDLSSDMIVRYSKSTFLDGKVHRLITQNETKKILCIDPKKCSYEVMSIPDLKDCLFVEIGQSQEQLHCLSLDNHANLFIWDLKSYTQQEWNLKYQLSLQQIYSALEPGLNVFSTSSDMSNGSFAFHPEKDLIVMPLKSEGFLLFDLQSGKREQLDVGHEVFSCWFYTSCYLV